MHATIAILIASIIQIILHRLIWKKIEKSHLIGLAILIPLGSLTLFFHDENILKWKPTIINWIFAALFFGSQYIGKKSLSQRFIDNAMSSSETIKVNLTNRQLQKINFCAVLFFIASGIINIWVAFNFSTETWVHFKLFGLMGLNLAALFGLMFYILKHTKEHSAHTSETITPPPSEGQD